MFSAAGGLGKGREARELLLRRNQSSHGVVLGPWGNEYLNLSFLGILRHEWLLENGLEKMNDIHLDYRRAVGGTA